MQLTDEDTKILEESIRNAHLELQREDVGWERMGTTSEWVMPEDTRRDIVRRARWYAVTNPIIKQQASLWVNYGISNGMKWKASTKADQRVIDDFMMDIENQAVTSLSGQRKAAKNLVTDGEIFYSLFLDPGRVVIRNMDALQIQEVLTDPDDVDVVRGFVRRYMARDGKTKREIVYRNWTNVNGKPGEDSSGKLYSNYKKQCVVYHKKLDDADGLRGNSLFTCSLDWAKQHSRFIQSRIAIMLAIAKFVWKVKAKGSEADIARIQKQFNSTLASQSTERNPPPVAGSAAVFNDGVDLESADMDTGADSAKEDGLSIMRMAGLGAGVFPQYLGDGDMANYAMANTMELPLTKQWNAFQHILQNMYSDIFGIVLQHVSPKKNRTKRHVDIYLPELIRKELAKVVDALAKLYSVTPGIAESDEMLRHVLSLFDIDNTQLVIDEIKQARSEMAQQQQQPEPEPTANDPSAATDGVPDE